MRKLWIVLVLMVILLVFPGCGVVETPQLSSNEDDGLINNTATPKVVVESTSTTEPIAEAESIFEKTSCPFDVTEGAEVECGYVLVPEDHNNPTGPNISLAVAVFKDQSNDRKSDPVILLCGGPGEKCLDSAPGLGSLLSTSIGARDLIIFDQRGAGLSEPALECPEWAPTMYDLLDEPDPEVAIRATFDSVMACRDRLLNEGHNLSAYNTVQNAADVNAIRIALGYDQVNLYGGSYGSLLAQATMRDYPQSVRSAILESVWPLEISFIVESSTTVPNAIIQLLEACAGDEKCDAAYPDLQDKLFAMIDRLNAEPVTISVTNPRDGQSYDALLTGNAVLGNLIAVLYQTPLIPTLPQAINDVYNSDYALMTQLTSARLLFFEAVSLGMEYSVVCSEDLIGRTADELLNAREAFPKQLLGSVDPDVWMENNFFAICKNWPVEEADQSVKEPLISDIPTLVLSGEFDPVTPSEFGRLVAGNLTNSTFLEIPGAGHSGETTSACALSVIAGFLDNNMIAPNASCISEMQGIVFDVPSPTAEVLMESYSDENRAFTGLAPAGWQEVAPAYFVRGSTTLDSTTFILEAAQTTAVELLASLAEQLGFDPGLEPVSRAEVGSFTWNFYTFEDLGYPSDLALAEYGEKAYFILLISTPEDHGILYEQVFIPATKAMAPLK